jgi:RNA polymerase sigma factor (sigma-70 family)
VTEVEREQAILSLAPIAHCIALHYCKRLPRTVGLEDIEQEAMTGAIGAVDKFDPSLGVPLGAYAQRRIRGAILDYLRSLDMRSRQDRAECKASGEDAPRFVSIDFVHASTRPNYAGAEAALDIARIVERTSLTPRMQSVVAAARAGTNQYEMADQFGIGQNRVSQIYHTAVKRMAQTVHPT